MSDMMNWPWIPHPAHGIADNALQAGQAALHNAYLVGFKDGLLLAVAIFSILLALYRRE
jgi:hypothetical protein